MGINVPNIAPDIAWEAIQLPIELVASQLTWREAAIQTALYSISQEMDFKSWWWKWDVAWGMLTITTNLAKSMRRLEATTGKRFDNKKLWWLQAHLRSIVVDESTTDLGKGNRIPLGSIKPSEYADIQKRFLSEARRVLKLGKGKY